MSNSFYNHGAFPSTGSAATSASMRAELDLVSAGFDKMPTLAGNANKFIIVNSTGTGLTQTDVLPAFTVTDTDFTVQDNGDNTRKFQFNAGSITTGNTRVYSMPDLDTTLVGTDVTQTLTNKTLTAPVIATIVNTGTLTLPTSTDTLVGRATTDTLTNKTLTNPVIGTIINTGTLTLPTSNDTLVGRATTDTLSNKSISGASNTLSNIGNSSLTNSSVVIGSSTLSLGGTLTTLAGVTISGASNTLSNIANASLTNSGVTFNGVTVALGASGTITASTTNALTVSTGLQLDTGTTFNGGAARTISIDSTVATLSGSQTLSNKTISGSSNTLSNIANASLTNSSITIGSSAISLGSTATTITGLTSLSSTGLVMTANAASSTAISAIAQSAGTVTVTAAGHGLNSGDLVSIDGVADYTYTGLVTVNVTNANVFTYSRTTTNASSSGGYVTKLQGTWASYSGGTGPSYKGGPMVVSASSQMPGLRVTQSGNGYAVIVEDAANPDTSAFIIANDGSMSINTNKFTVDAATGNTVIAGTTSFGGNIVSNVLFTDATYDIGATGANRPRDLFLSRNLTVGGTLTLAGGVNLNGNVTIGDASSDTLTINSTITSNLIFTDNTYDIGASGATRPRNLYLAGLLTMGGALSVTGATTLTGALNANGNVTLGNAAADSVTVTGTITSNLLFTDNTYNIGAIGATRPANVYVAAGVTAGVGMSVSKSSTGTSPYLSIDNASSDGGIGTRIFLTNSGTSAKYNWVFGTQIVNNDALDFVPSTTLGGGTYSNPTLSLKPGGDAVLRGTIWAKGGGSTFGNGAADTSSAAEIALDSGTANKYSDIDYLHGGVLKWRVGTNGGDNLNVFRTGVGNIAIFEASDQSLTLYNNLNFGVGKTITWDSNYFYLQTRSASVPVVTLMNSATGNYPPRLDLKNGTNTATVISLDAGSSGDSYFNTGATLIVGNTLNYTGARLFVDNTINTNYSGTIGMRYNVSGSTSSYYKGMTGTAPNSGGAARGLHLFNYDQDSNPGIEFWNGLPGSAVWNATLTPSGGDWNIRGSAALGWNARAGSTTGDFLSTGGGNSSTYNGLAIISNAKALGTQANTGLASWIVDIGGRAADGTTFNVNTANKFRVAYAAGGTSFYSATDVFSINNAGYATFGTNQVADTTYNGLVQIRGDVAGSRFDALTIQNNNNNPSGQSVRARWKTSAGGGPEQYKFGFIDYTAVSNYGEQGRFSFGVANVINTTPAASVYIDGGGLRVNTSAQVDALTVFGNTAFATGSGDTYSHLKAIQFSNVAQNTWYTVDTFGNFEAVAFLLMVSYEYNAGDGNDRFALFIPTGSTYGGGVTMTRLGGSTDIEIQMSGGTTMQIRQIHVGTATGILRAVWLRMDGIG